MSDIRPKVSLGMPVYNGENYLKEALDSILSQTFRDFEVVISDNASVDGTEAICRAYAGKDKRIKYFRNERNLGAAANFNLAFALSGGEYFKWAAHDDVLHPSFLASCVAVLDKDPEVVLCYTKTNQIDERGNITREYELDNEMAIDFLRPHERFRTFIGVPHFCLSVFGLFRRKTLEQTKLIGGYHSSDKCLLAEVSLCGRVARVQEFFFYRRHHQECSVLKYKGAEARTAWFDPLKAGKRCYPCWKISSEHLKSIFRAPLDLSQRLLCVLVLLRWSILMRSYLGREILACKGLSAIHKMLRSSAQEE